MFLVYLLAVVSTVGCQELQPAPNDGDSEEKCVCNPVVNVGSQPCNFDGQVADFQTVLIAQQAQITRLQNESKSSEIHLLNLLAEQKKITNNLKTRVTQLEERSKANCPVGNGASYRGTVSVTKTGKTCQRWDSQTPHEHIYTPDSYPSYGLEQNYCRNPSNHNGVWCYTMESNTRWETCDVPVCEVITCPARYELFNGNCYRFSTDQKPYNEAQAICQEEGGHLATAKNNETHDFLANHVRDTTKGNTWIGLSDVVTEGQWVWDDGTLLVGDGIWGTNEPYGAKRENCAHIYPDKDYRWNDSTCPSSYYYICEISG